MAYPKFEVRDECWGEPHCRVPSRGVEFLGTLPQLGSELGGQGAFRCLHYSAVEPVTLRPQCGW